MSKKRCLLVIDDLGMGGAQRQMVNLALSLQNKGFSIDILYYFRRNSFSDILSQTKITLTLIEKQNPVSRIFHFRKFIRNGEYEVVVSFLAIPSFLCEIASIPNKKWRLIVSERSSNPLISKSIKSIILRFFHVFADFVVFNSHSNLQLIRKVNPFISTNKFKVIYNMLDLSEWKPPGKHIYRRSGKTKIVVIANFRRLKNLNGLLKALLLLSLEERNLISISWYGNGLIEPFLDNSIVDDKSFIINHELENVITLCGATGTVKEIMMEADIVGLFSHFEGLPNSVCEGMAVGKPILSTSVSDIPILIEDGINGKLCESGKPESIADALRFFIRSDLLTLNDMGERNRKKAMDLFDREKIILQYTKLFE